MTDTIRVKQRWLLYGAKGWIGGKFASLVRAMHAPTVELLIANTRADDYTAALSEIQSVAPDRVISMVGRTTAPHTADAKQDTTRTTIDYLEGPGMLRHNLRDNLIAALTLERICHDLGIHFTCLGTGCIFTSSTKVHPFGEGDDATFFGSSYSTVKGFADSWLRHSPNALNVRLRMPITADLTDPKNLLTKLLAYAKTQIHSTLNSMSVLDDLLPILADLILKGHKGTVHLVNPGAMRHDDVLQMYREIVDPTLTWKSVSEKEMESILIAKRSSCVLDTDKLTRLYPDVPLLSTSIRKIFLSHKHLK